MGRKYGVQFKVVGRGDDSRTHVGMVSNLSQGGVVLVAKHPLESGTILELEFPDSIFGGPRKLTGRVVWLRSSTEGDTLVGCQFVRVAGGGETTARRLKGESMKSEPVVADGRERRRYQRWEQKLQVHVRCVTPGPWHEKEVRPAMLEDVSKGGVEIVTTREYLKNLILEMAFPESPLGPAQKYHARVLRSSVSGKPGHFALGCTFVKLAKPSE